MPTTTYDLLASISISSNTESVQFTSIGSSYRDLVLVGYVAKGSNGATNVRFRFNGDTGNNYNFIAMEGNAYGPIAWLVTNDDAYSISGNSWSLPRNFGNFVMNIMDYSQTNKHKTILAQAGDADEGLALQGVRYASTSAISSILITTLNSVYTMGSGQFHLFGVI